ncbi:bis-aminopropyl spermidine synthase family protein [Parasphingorhabdus pacifica]
MNTAQPSRSSPDAESAAHAAVPRTPEASSEPAVSSETAGGDAVEELLASLAILARPLRHVLAMLAEGSQTLEDLVRHPAVPRRSVEELLAACGADVESAHGTYRLLPAVRAAYRDRFALDELRSGTTDRPATLRRLREFIDAGPAPSAALDHVTATAESVLRRAEWMCENYDLRGAKLLCLGDHDLTSLAVALVEPSVSVTVVDVDERILAHIDALAAGNDFRIRTLHADLRFGLPSVVSGWADVVVTDPPYTPEGVGLFAARAAECLAGSHGRVLIAYGFSDRSPALGHKVQQELLRLGMVFEAILPAFHRYFGAQAIGSASDLYVCRPTSSTRKLALKDLAGIYTHGPQSVESHESGPSEEFLGVVGERLGAELTTLREPGWSRPLPGPKAPTAFDLRADPGPWLLRMLLACNDEHVGFVVANKHPDIVDERSQLALSELVAAKYSLRFHRSTPDSKHAVVVAHATGTGVAARLLQRVHGKLGNTWREALIAQAAQDGSTFTKREANDHVRELAPRPADLDLRLIDLPRHRVAELLRVV